jgi:outer membrane autotransporter protein
MTVLAGLFATEAAEARCVNTTTGGQATDGVDMPSSGQSVVCSTAAPNPSTTTVTSTAGSTGVTVTVMPGATVSTTARAIGLDGNASSILNQGTVQTSGLNAFGLSVLPGRNGDTITNSGLVTTTGTRGHGLDARGSNSTIVNQGTVSVSGPGASGIRSIETTTGTLITNSGTVTANGGSSAAPAPAISANGVSLLAGTFQNLAGGTVSSTQAFGVLGGDGNITVRNAGTITGGNGIAINLGNGNDIIEVTGGQINGAIVTGTGNDQFTMSGGTVTGNINLGNGNNAVTMTGGQINGSIALGAGTDTVQLFTGATITGSIDGGGGTNAITLDGTGAGSFAGTISNFQTLTKQNSGTWEMSSSIAGATAVAVNGGTLVLSANNTYTGGTTISGGTLQLGNGGTTGSVVGNITDNGALAINHSNTVVFPGAISGTGSLSQIGTGTTILTGDNTYTGGTTIAAGTLQLGNGGITGSIVGDVVDNTALVVNHSNTVTLPGVISGTGSLAQNGTGTTILTGDNTYTGGTTIAAGTLQLGNGGTTGSVVGNITDNGTLAVNHSNTVTLPGVISGTGSLSQIGTGTTVLSADNTYTGGTTIAAGTLQLGNGGTTGSVVGNITDNGTLAVNHGNTVTLPGVISGTGSVSQNGTGTTILTASNNNYTGTTTVANGTLALGASGALGQSSSLIVNLGATANINGTTQNPGALDISGTLDLAQGTLSTSTALGTGALTTHSGSTVNLNGGTLNIANGGTTAPGSLTGAGSFNLAGGTLDVNGANPGLTGSTAIASGATAVLNDGGGLGSGAIANSGSLIFSAATGTFVNNVTGAGSVSLTNGSNVIATGAIDSSGPKTIDAGSTLQLGNGGTSGNIVGNITNNGSLLFDRSDVNTYADVISGTGSVSQIGSGTTILNGNNSYAGGTQVNAGTFVIGDANHPGAALSGGGPIQIATGGTLGGYGSVTGPVNNSGTIGVGNTLAALSGGPNGNFTINGNLTNSGLAQIGGAGTGTGNTLTIAGNYIGAGGALHLNAVLGTDGSPSDRLVIAGAGASASGATGVVVANVGGGGAVTVSNGIAVVQVTGGATTAAGSFSLAGPAAAGALEYMLFKGGIGGANPDNWYLRSALLVPVPTLAPGAQPVAEPPQPLPLPAPPPAGFAVVELIRPEVAVHSVVPDLTRTLGLLALGTFHERRGDQALLDSAPAAWGRVFGQHDKEQYSGGVRPDFSGTFAGFQAGFDALRFETFGSVRNLVGVSVGHARATGEVSGFVLGVEGAHAGTIDLGATSVGGYWTMLGSQGWYVDMVVQGDFIDGTPHSDRNIGARISGANFVTSVEAGLPIALGAGIAVEPQAQFIYQRLGLNGTQDRLSSIGFAQSDVVNGRIGMRLTGTFGSGGAVWTPYLKTDVWWSTAGADDVAFATNVLSTLRNAGPAVEVGGGVSGQLTRFVSVYGDASYRTAIDNSLTIYKGNVGLRVTW